MYISKECEPIMIIEDYHSLTFNKVLHLGDLFSLCLSKHRDTSKKPKINGK